MSGQPSDTLTEEQILRLRKQSTIAPPEFYGLCAESPAQGANLGISCTSSNSSTAGHSITAGCSYKPLSISRVEASKVTPSNLLLPSAERRISSSSRRRSSVSTESTEPQPSKKRGTKKEPPRPFIDRGHKEASIQQRKQHLSGTSSSLFNDKNHTIFQSENPTSQQVANADESSRFCEQRARHKSLPPRLPADGSLRSEKHSSVRADYTDGTRVLHETSNNSGVSDGMKELFAKVLDEKLDEKFKKHFEQLERHRRDANRAEPSASHRKSRPEPVVQAPSRPLSVLARRPVRLDPLTIDLSGWTAKASKLSIEERKRRWPEQDSEIPTHRRRSEDEIVAIGKLVHPYERHFRASYAFSYWGRLRKEYMFLVTKSDGNGGTVWTPADLNRVLRG